MDAVLAPILQSPRLPDYVRELNDFLKKEQEKRAEFYEKVRDDEKAEFINGEVICHSPAKEKHTLVRQNLEMIFVRFVRKTKTGVVRTEKALVKLSRNDFEPDLCFFNNEKAASFNAETLFYPAPDFVVEILSTSTASRDRGVKKDDYALHGVKEYWIIDPDKKEVEQFLLLDGQFELKEKVSHSTVRCAVLQGLEVPLTAIFEEEANEQFLSSI